MTVGGAISGLAGDATSFEKGFFHDTCLNYEVRPNNHPLRAQSNAHSAPPPPPPRPAAPVLLCAANAPGPTREQTSLSAVARWYSGTARWQWPRATTTWQTSTMPYQGPLAPSVRPPRPAAPPPSARA
jgi:hypothetical protein